MLKKKENSNKFGPHEASSPSDAKIEESPDV